MKSLNIFLLMMFLGFNSHAGTEAPIQIRIGGVLFKVVLGNIVHQKTEALALSHWPTATNDGGGVGGAIANAGGEVSLRQFQNILKENGGSLPYTTVYPTSIESGSQLKAHTLLNVIELGPSSLLKFDTIAELEASHFPFPPEVIDRYKQLLISHTAEIQALKAEEQEVTAKLAETKSRQEFLNVLKNKMKIAQSNFSKERNNLISPYLKPIGFQTVVTSVRNTLAKAVELKIKSVSLATMGYGIMGDLDMLESLAAILTGVSSFSLPPGTDLEVRLVIYGQDNIENRSFVEKNLLPIIQDGKFLAMAELNGFGNNASTDLTPIKDRFLKTDQASLKTHSISVTDKAIGRLTRVKNGCVNLFDRIADYFGWY